MTGVVDDVLPISADYGDFLADSESVDCAGVNLAGLAVSGEGIVSITKITNREAISEGEVESVRTGVVVEAGSVDDFVSSEAGQALEIDGVVVDAGKSLLIGNSLSARLHVSVGIREC